MEASTPGKQMGTEHLQPRQNGGKRLLALWDDANLGRWKQGEKKKKSTMSDWLVQTLKFRDAFFPDCSAYAAAVC